jgi:hypothetical protein
MNLNKLIWAILGAVFLGAKGFLDDGHLDIFETLSAVALALGALETWLAPNTDLLATAKTWVHAGLAGMGVLILALPDGVTGSEWYDVAIMIGTTAGVWAIPNQVRGTPTGVPPRQAVVRG